MNETFVVWDRGQKFSRVTRNHQRLGDRGGNSDRMILGQGGVNGPVIPGQGWSLNLAWGTDVGGV